MTSSDLIYVMTGHGCADEPADEDTPPEERTLDDETALCEAIALVELLICREQMRRKGSPVQGEVLYQLKRAQSALTQITGGV